MTFTPQQNSALSAPLDRSVVAQRQQGGGKVSYIEGWHAIAEANRIFGFDGWHRETIDLRQLGEPREQDGKMRVDYMARVRITVGDIIRDGCGFGQGIDKDRGQAHESALKEAETDAMKRALMTFGNPFGLALYDKSQSNVADTPSVVETINDEQWAVLVTLIEKAGMDAKTVCDSYQIDGLKALPAHKYEKLKLRLDQVISDKANPNPQQKAA